MRRACTRARAALRKTASASRHAAADGHGRWLAAATRPVQLADVHRGDGAHQRRPRGRSTGRKPVHTSRTSAGARAAPSASSSAVSATTQMSATTWTPQPSPCAQVVGLPHDLGRPSSVAGRRNLSTRPWSPPTACRERHHVARLGHAAAVLRVLQGLERACSVGQHQALASQVHDLVVLHVVPKR